MITGNFNKYGYDKTKWYTIDYEILNKIVAETLENTHSAKVAPSKVQELHDGECKSCTTNTKDYTENTTEITIKCIKGSASEKLKADDGFDKNILDKQILKGFHALGYYQGNLITDGLKVINYYYKKFYDTFGEEHPRLSNDAMKGVIERYCSTYSIVEGFNDLDTYQCLIDKHFETYYKNCDYNICHFMTDGIRDNRYYETLY